METASVYAAVATGGEGGRPASELTYALLAIAAAISELAAAVTATGIMLADLAERDED